MEISDEALAEFIDICEREHKVRLEPKDARIIAKRLLLLYELMHRPVPDDAMPPSARSPGDDLLPGAP